MKKGTPKAFKGDLRPRVVSAAILMLVSALTTWAGGVVFAAAIVFLSSVLYYEWTRMTLLPTQAFSVLWCAGIVVVCAVLMLFNAVGPAFWFAVGGAALLAVLVHFEVFAAASLRRAKWAISGLFYALALGLSLLVIRGEETAATSWAEAFGDPGLVRLLFLFLVVWSTDIFAYFVGRSLGGPKLLPAVSPKKTISGALGGIVAAVLVGILFGAEGGALVALGSVALAVTLSALSQAGDLFESWIKRRYAFKDSSNLIPGHGGFMDRVDGLVFAAVPLALYTLATT